MFTAGDGWRAKPEDTVLKALATFSGLNLGTVDKDGIAKWILVPVAGLPRLPE